MTGMTIQKPQLQEIVDAANTILDVTDEIAGEGSPWVDIVTSLPTSHKPFQKYIVRRGWTFWQKRKLSDVDSLTIHHTCSHSPLGTAKYCVYTKGYSSIQYHLWVAADDNCTVYLCAPLEWMIWHDHTGAYPKSLSIGMAGDRSVTRPPQEQIVQTADLCNYLLTDVLSVNGGREPSYYVVGHRDRPASGGTKCPGWDHIKWRQDFYDELARS